MEIYLASCAKDVDWQVHTHTHTHTRIYKYEAFVTYQTSSCDKLNPLYPWVLLILSTRGELIETDTMH